MHRKLAAVVLSLAMLLAVAAPAPAHADMKKTGTILAVVGLGLVGAGVVMYLTRGEEPYSGPPEFNMHVKKSATPALIVGGAGVATMSLGVSLINKAKKKEQGISLVPRPGGVALAYNF